MEQPQTDRKLTLYYGDHDLSDGAVGKYLNELRRKGIQSVVVHFYTRPAEAGDRAMSEGNTDE